MANQQPSNIEPYVQPNNPVTRDPLESKATDQIHRHGDSSSSDRAGGAQGRQPQEGIPSSLGQGVQNGSGPVDSLEARSTGVNQTAGNHQQNENVDAEQMATLAEGEVAGAVDRKSGTQQAPGQGPAEAQDFASDLDRYIRYLLINAISTMTDSSTGRRLSRQLPVMK